MLPSASSEPLSGLSKEYQNLYTRLVGVLSSGDSSQVKGAMKVLSGDRCLSPLLPPLCRHLYSTARSTTSTSSRPQSLQVVLSAIGALASNKGMGASLVLFLGQLLGAILAILLAPSLTGGGGLQESDGGDDRVRLQAAMTLGQLLATFRYCRQISFN